MLAPELAGVCPNYDSELVRRTLHPAGALLAFPARSERTPVKRRAITN